MNNKKIFTYLAISLMAVLPRQSYGSLHLDVTGTVSEAIHGNVNAQQEILRTDMFSPNRLKNKKAKNMRIVSIKVRNATIKQLAKVDLMSLLPDETQKIIGIQFACNASDAVEETTLELNKAYTNEYSINTKSRFLKEQTDTTSGGITLPQVNFSKSRVNHTVSETSKETTEGGKDTVEIKKSQKLTLKARHAVIGIMKASVIETENPVKWELPFVLNPETVIEVTFKDKHGQYKAVTTWGKIKHKLPEAEKIKGYLEVDQINAGSVYVTVKNMDDADIQKYCPEVAEARAEYEARKNNRKLKKASTANKKKKCVNCKTVSKKDLKKLAKKYSKK